MKARFARSDLIDDMQIQQPDTRNNGRRCMSAQVVPVRCHFRQNRQRRLGPVRSERI